MDLTEAEDIKKRWQEYTEELYKEDLHDPDDHDGVITNIEPGILEYEVKWALGSIYCFIDYAKAFDCGTATNSGKFLKRWEYQTTWLAPGEIYMQVRKQQLGLNTTDLF